MGEGELLFKVTEPSGKVYRIFTDGTIEGFAEGSWLVNRYPGLLRFNMLGASECPAKNDTASGEGASPG